MEMGDLPLLQKHYCILCQAWIKNSSSDEEVAIFVHKEDVPHPDGFTAKYISNTDLWN